MTSAARLTDEALRDIQGVITSGYGHLPFAAYLFVTITDADDGRQWLSRIADSVTSSHRRGNGHSAPEDRPPAAVNIGITASGLRAVGLPDEVLRTFPVEFQDGIASDERSRILGDSGTSAPETWEIGGPRTEPAHALLMLFAADEATLAAMCRTHRALLASSGGAVELPGGFQRGFRPDTFAEPFGFHDGIAQPSIAGLSGHGVPTGEFILGYENHYGLMPPTPVVPREMNAAPALPPLDSPYHAGKQLGDLGRNGSYLVYRKLQQDVAGFWQFMAREATRDGGADAARMVWLASKCVGRWPSGAPLMLAPDADNPGLADRDDFFYADDLDGLRCPLGSHIRRTNPRDVLKPYPREQSLSMTEAHRLLRRGRAYGAPLFDASVLRHTPDAELFKMLANLQDDGQPRGVHFFCVNASLKSQFEFVQQAWCNNPRFGGLNDNVDPLTSSACPPDSPSRMTIPRQDGALRTNPLPQFVTVRAGAYMFLPSLTALRFLGSRLPR
jgi:Dyp-type peroxidase family